jgi:hypothetical protein
MSRVKVTYVAILNGYKPIMTASTLDELKGGLDDYYAVGSKGEAECWGFDPSESKYPDLDDYQGCFTYAWKNVTRDEVMVIKDKVKVYCVDYYPHTTYEIMKFN